MKRRKSIWLVISILLLCVALVFSACGTKSNNSGDNAAKDTKFQPVTLRMATDHPIDHMGTRAANAIIEEIKTKTEGRVNIVLYPASQLGDYNTVFEEIVRGTIDIACHCVPDALDSRLGIPYCPYLTTGYEEAKTVYAPDSFLSTKFGEITDKLGVKFLGFFFEGYIGMGTMKEPKDVMVPGAKKGLQIRVWAAPGSRIPMEDLGYTAVTVPYAEAPTAMKTGVVDGWIGGTPNVNYHWVGEVIKYFYETHMHAEMSSFVMNKGVLKKLLPEDQKVVIETFAKYSADSFNVAKSEDEKWMAQLEKSGVKVVRFSDKEMQMMADYVRTNSWPKLEKVYTKELLDGLKAQY